MRLWRVALITAIVIVLFFMVMTGYLLWSGDIRLFGREIRLLASVNHHPGSLNVRLELIDYLLSEHKFPLAAAHAFDGLKLIPKEPSLLRRAAATCGLWGKETKSKRASMMAAKLWQELIDNGDAELDDKIQFANALIRGEDPYRALVCCEPLLKTNPNNAQLLFAVGCALKVMGKYERALPLLQKATLLAPADYDAWRWLAAAQRSLGDYGNAIQSAKMAAGLCPEELKEELRLFQKSTEDLRISTPSEDAFWAHYRLACKIFAHENRPDLGSAEYEICLKMAPQTTTDSNIRISCCYAREEISDFKRYIGDYEGAYEYLKIAIDEYNTLKIINRLQYAYEDLVDVYDNLAKKYTTKKEEFLDKEEEAQEKKLEYSKEAQNEHFQRHAISEQVYFLKQRYGLENPHVIELREEMRKQMPTDEPTNDCSYASLLSTEGFFLCDERKYPEAEKTLLLCASHYDDSDFINNIEFSASLFATLGSLAFERGDLQTAIQRNEKAVGKLSVMRNMLGADQFRRKVGRDSWSEIFDNLLFYCQMKEDPQAIFTYSEQYKARALLDLLGSKGDENRFKQNMLLSKVVVPEEEPASAEPKTVSETHEEQVRDLALEETQFQRLPEDTSASAAQVPSFVNANPFSLDELQPLMSDINLITYFLGNTSCAVVLTKKDVKAIALDGTSAETLKDEVLTYQEALTANPYGRRDLQLELDGQGHSAAGSQELDALSSQLYEQLIEPVLPYLTEDTVCICPDGILNNLPFEALAKDGRRLVEDFAIFYAPSASVLKLCMDRNRDACESILALGNPNLQNPAFRLFNAETEVSALERFFPRADVYTADAATETIVKERAPAYDVLHFACHGELNLDDPMLTSLRLAPDTQNDGYFHAGEIFDLDLNASLVVLSACNTALGELSTGNELMGLPRSFLYAGAPAIVASLWTVDDRSTSLLMQGFYENLGSMNKAQALRHAKLDVMKEYPNPFYWAAFCLQGDYR